MPVIQLQTSINAPVSTVFDLARSVELHMASTAQTREVAVAGRTSGLCEAGDIITWEATHFGIRQRLTVEITRMDPPFFFEDHMVRGAFRSFSHQHTFQDDNGRTVMHDRFEFKAPFGLFGRLAEALFLKRYMKNLLMRRNDLIRNVAEGQAEL